MRRSCSSSSWASTSPRSAASCSLRAGLFGQLREAQRLDLQFVRARLRVGGFAARRHQPLRGVGIGGLGAHQGRAGLLADQRLGAQLAVEVLHLLLARQHAGLLGVGGVEVDAVRADRMAALHVDRLAGLQRAALGQSLLEARGGVAAVQPVGQQGLLARVVEAQQARQPRQIGGAFGHTGHGRAEEGQLGGRRVVGEGADHVEAADLERAQALAQRGFERVLPALLDVDAAPQALQAVEPVLGEPGRELAVGLDLLLQRAQCLEPRRQLGMARTLAVHRLLARATVVVEPRHRFLQVLQPRVGLAGRFLRGLELLLHRHQLRLVGRGQCVLVGAQPFAALVELARLLLDVALVGRQHLDLLLHLHDGRALRIGLVLRPLLRFLELGHARVVLLELGREQHGLLLGVHALTGQRFDLGLGLDAAVVPLRDLLAQLHQPLLHALAALDHEADLALEPADLGAGLVELALRLIHQVAGAVVGLAHGLELVLDVAQVGRARLEVVDRLLGLGLDARLVALALGALEEPQLVLLLRGIALQRVVACGHLGLLLELLEIGVELAQDVLDAREVLARVAQAVLGLAAAFLVLRDARGFLEEQAQFLGLRFDDPADRALADDGVGARAQTGAEEHVLHVAPAHRLVVDEVAAGAVAREHAPHRDFAELVPLAAGAVVGVVEHQFHARAAGLLARGRAVEDHVLHRLAAQFRGTRFAEHPAHRIHDVRLAATVGPDHPDQLARQQEVGGFGERLEARELDGIETHDLSACPASLCPGPGGQVNN